MTEPAKVALTRVVVDDSPVQRRFLRAAVEADPDFSVVGEARNGKEAVALVARLRPAAVLMDLDLPVMSGIEAIEHIMAASPTPIVVYSAHVGGVEKNNALEALAAGAVDVMAKPGADDRGTLEEYADQLRRRLRWPPGCVSSHTRAGSCAARATRRTSAARASASPVGVPTY